MRFLRWSLAVMLVVPMMITATAAQQPAPARGAQRGAGAPAGGPAMRLTSTSFPDGTVVPVKYSQAGAQLSPASTTSLPEGVPKGDLKDGSHQTSASGDGVYRGPGAVAAGPLHHYVFELYAIDTKVDVPGGGDPFETRAKVLQAIQGHILGKAVYMGLFRRPA
jgi:phosphatidylethanolamine-binding protein (PEBP) family uncharacterized protein